MLQKEEISKRQLHFPSNQNLHKASQKYFEGFMRTLSSLDTRSFTRLVFNQQIKGHNNLEINCHPLFIYLLLDGRTHLV